MAQAVELPQTGQTTSYSAGDDGDILAGVTWPSPRFTDNGNGTVTDNLTGLIWLQNANCFGGLTWAGALTAANTLNNGECGLSDSSVEGDWRLSNVNELVSIAVHAGVPDVAAWLNTQGLHNAQANTYWSSTSIVSNPARAWIVFLTDARVYYSDKPDIGLTHFAWPVRSGPLPAAVELPKTGQTTCYDMAGTLIACAGTGQDGEIQAGVAWPEPRFTVSGDCVSDNLTGLMWPRNRELFSPWPLGHKYWDEALNDANGLTLCGFTDWRLPNRAELRSVVHYGQALSVEWLLTQGFINMADFSVYWSSTSWAENSGNAYNGLFHGTIAFAGKTGYNGGVWPVRSGALAVNADLSVTKTDTPDPVTVGSNLTYTVVVTNNGPSYASGVTLTDTLPTNVTFVSAAPTQGSCADAAGALTCALGTLADGAAATVTIVVTTTTMGPITNTASVTGNETDLTPANNTAQAVTTVSGPSTDLAVTKTDSPDPVKVGNRLTYTVVVTNNGPSPATGVKLTDTLPFGVTLVSFMPTQGSCTHTWVVTFPTVICTLGNLANGASATVTIVVIPSGLGTQIANTAAVTGNEIDPIPDNNFAQVMTTVIPLASDLAVTIADSPDPVTVGSNLTYTVEVTNNGPDQAPEVRLSNYYLPTSVTIVSATPTQGYCLFSFDTVSCNLGNLANGAKATVTIVVTPKITGLLDSGVSIYSRFDDTTPANNRAYATTMVNGLVGRADLAITLIAFPDPAHRARSLFYTVTVKNYGPSPATGVTLTDTLPPNYVAQFIWAWSTLGRCAEAAGVVSCALGNLANGATATVTIIVRPNFVGSILVDTATVTGNETDPTPANNTAQAVTSVTGGGGSSQ